MILDFLRVYTPPARKTRVGCPNGDGGYVVIDLPDAKYDVLIAGGVADQVEFEDTFLERWKIPCYAYDGTINPMILLRQRLTLSNRGTCT